MGGIALRSIAESRAGPIFKCKNDEGEFSPSFVPSIVKHYAGINVNAGLVGAVLDGYPRVQNGDRFAALLPMVSVQAKCLGVNVILVPTIKDHLHGAVALQLKIRIW